MQNKKDEDEVQKFEKLEISTVLQETKIFTQTGVKARKCCTIITKLLYLIHQGQRLTTMEATNVFFQLTRLFQMKDATLRRLLYLAIKELSYADHVMMVTSSLTKDISGRDDNYRAAAIRALCKVTDATNLQAIERYIKQCIVDRNPSVASSAIVCSLRLFEQNHDVVKRWASEIQGALQSKSSMVQYHALGLLYQIRKKDRLAIMKLVTSVTRGNINIKSPHAICMIIRYVSITLEELDDPSEKRHFLEYLEYCLSDSHEMVMYEAVCAICNLTGVSSRELGLAVSALQLFLASPQPTMRFAAIRTLSQISYQYPSIVATCNLDMEALITDPNKSIGVMAITTLLKTGNEQNIERLINQIPPLLVNINDDFKIIVIKAIGDLCVKFPTQQHVMMNFLAGVLRDQGGYEYKLQTVNTLIAIITELPNAREVGLMHLSEFIEDCDHPSLSARVLRLLGELCPSMPQPSKYIKYIHNRVILEEESVRAAAVSALAKIGVQCQSLAPAISILLERCKYDVDDEVRDRATFYYDLINKDYNLANKLLKSDELYSINSLEQCLVQYIGNSDGDLCFDIKDVPINISDTSSIKKRRGDDKYNINNGLMNGGISSVGSDENSNPNSLKSNQLTTSSKKPKSSIQEQFAKELAMIPEFSTFGSLFKSSKPVMLTESETEYVVSCVKHTFKNHLVLQFTITNTIQEYKLENIQVESICEDDNYTLIESLPIESLSWEEEKSAYVAFELPDNALMNIDGHFINILKFYCIEVDTEDGIDDEYELEELDVTIQDHILPVKVDDFNHQWEKMEEEEEEMVEESQVYELTNMDSIQKCVEQLLDVLGMYPCERSDTVEQNKNSHSLLLSGYFRGNHQLLVKARMAFQRNTGVTMQLTIRCHDSVIASLLINSIA